MAVTRVNTGVAAKTLGKMTTALPSTTHHQAIFSCCSGLHYVKYPRAAISSLRRKDVVLLGWFTARRVDHTLCLPTGRAAQKAAGVTRGCLCWGGALGTQVGNPCSALVLAMTQDRSTLGRGHLGKQLANSTSMHLRGAALYELP